jgi:hypothetical protein
MLWRTVVASVVLAAGAAANAAEPRPNGLYAGGSFGTSVFEDDGAFAGLPFDDTDTAIQGHFGYKFLPFLSIEGRYSDYGTFTFDGLDAGMGVTVLSAHAVGIVPFGSSGWELFGQLGLGSVELDFAGTDESQATFSAGIGVRFHAMENFSIGVQTDAHVWEEESFGFSLIPGIGATQATVQITF